MKVTVEMSKDEFLDWINFKGYKNQIISGIIGIEDTYNSLVKWFMDLDNQVSVPDPIYKTFEDDVLYNFRHNINKFKEGSDNDYPTT